MSVEESRAVLPTPLESPTHPPVIPSAIARRLLFGGVWLGFVVYAFGFAPPDSPETWTLIQRLVTGQLAGINPAIIALFNLMGVFPLIYMAVMLVDGQGQSVKAAPFVLGSFAVGAFAILPYLGLRSPHPQFTGQKNWLLRGLESRWFVGGLAIAALALMLYGLTQGDWHDFATQWRTQRFIHVMSLDFCLLSLLFPVLLGDDMARRQWYQPARFWSFALIPCLGAAVYLVCRPAIAEK